MQYRNGSSNSERDQGTESISQSELRNRHSYCNYFIQCSKAFHSLTLTLNTPKNP